VSEGESQDQNVVTLEVKDHVALVQLNRPDALNAMSTALFTALERVFIQIEEDSSVWAVILTGAGRAFCVGADLRERQGMSVADIRRRRRISVAAFAAIARCKRPLITAVNGFAFGGGLELALMGDIILGGDSARFAALETTLGIMPAGGATQRLPRLIGINRAKELIFTGRKISAHDAFELGLLNRVVADAELLPAARALADEILNNAPTAVAQAKRALNASMNMGLEAGLAFEVEAAQTCLHSPDRLEGLAAAREKRKPRFTGE